MLLTSRVRQEIPGSTIERVSYNFPKSNNTGDVISRKLI